MREIKFRIWFAGKMGEGFTIQDLYDSCYDHEALDAQHEVIKDTVFLQYTGLKDRLGKEIYEGDILKYKYNKKCYEMGFEDGMFDLVDFDEYTMDQMRAFYDGEDWKIVGNIYENADLLLNSVEE